METELLTSLGLSDLQAKTYEHLAKNGAGTAPSTAQALKESRTNTYNVLDKLLDMGLVKRFKQNKKFVFQAEPPTALQKLAEQKRDAALQYERQLHALMPSMLEQYFSGNEKPGVRFFQGKTEVQEAYEEQTEVGKSIYMIRPVFEKDLLDYKYLSSLRHEQRRKGVWRHAITPDQKGAPKNYLESDPFMLVDRTWIGEDEYTAPVEWAAYGNKLSIYSFGSEAMAMTIDSPQVAEAFRQLFKMLSKRIRKDKNYDTLPQKADYIASTKNHLNKRP